jgi:hypothetical protein
MEMVLARSFKYVRLTLSIARGQLPAVLLRVGANLSPFYVWTVQKDRGTLMQHMRTASGFRLIQRRSKNGTCASYPQFAAFADDCYAGVTPQHDAPKILQCRVTPLSWIPDTYLNGKVGLAYDSTTFKGNWSGTEYMHQSNSVFDFGFIENFDENRTNTELHLQRLR